MTDDPGAEILRELCTKHADTYGVYAHPVLADLVVARSWLEEALASADPATRIAGAARAAHALDAVLERVSTLRLPQELRLAVDSMVGELREKLGRG